MFPMTAEEINQKIKGSPVCDTNLISDGYHTFKELYDMRLALTVALFRKLEDMNRRSWESSHTSLRQYPYQHITWRSRQHSDGTMFEGMFIVGVYKTPGKMITFHYHDEHWNRFGLADVIEKAPEWDGHTDKDVIERLLAL